MEALHVIVFKEVRDDGAIAIVERLARVIWTEHFVPIIGMPQVEYMLKEFQSASAISKYMSQGYAYYWVDLDGVPVGYVAVAGDVDKKELYLSKFYLLSAHRGKGWGRQMMDFVKTLARDGGFKTIALNTNKKNLDTILFYEKAGFLSRRSDVIDLGHGFVADDWRMEMVV
jgi:GNAT superfamily N-acetyltransferase